MIPILLSIVATGVLLAELWTGTAVAGWTVDNMLIEREKYPGPYWFVMALQMFIGATLVVLAIYAM